MRHVTGAGYRSEPCNMKSRLLQQSITETPLTEPNAVTVTVHSRRGHIVYLSCVSQE